MLVTKFVFSYDPQITKTRIFKIFKSKKTLFFGLSMLVGISEAIRLLFFEALFYNKDLFLQPLYNIFFFSLQYKKKFLRLKYLKDIYQFNTNNYSENKFNE
jgi:hypothetical protein